jgi:hypothetical protein
VRGALEIAPPLRQPGHAQATDNRETGVVRALIAAVLAALVIGMPRHHTSPGMCSLDVLHHEVVDLVSLPSGVSPSRPPCGR